MVERIFRKVACLVAALLVAMVVRAGGAFCNPVVWADVPDPDVIRVGDDYWLVSTTMHLMPGAPIMHAKDLVNWETVSYLFDSLHDTPKYDMQGGTVYGRGQWATSLRYHDGTYYALFSPNDEPYLSYVYTSKDPRVGWTLHSRLPHFHDSSLFFDDDGRVYVFSGTGEGPKCSASVELFTAHMKDGDIAGIAAFNGHSGVISISKENGKTWLTVTNETVNLTDKEHLVTSVNIEEKVRVSLDKRHVYLRIDGDFNVGKDIATFYYSLNGKTWNPVGGDFLMKYDYMRLFMGTRYAIFNYATKTTGGYVEFDNFDYKLAQ